MTNCCRKKNEFDPERLTANTKQLGIALGQSISVRTVCTFCGLKARHVTAWGEAHGAKPQVNISNCLAVRDMDGDLDLVAASCGYGDKEVW